MRFGILGPLEVTDGGRNIDVAGGKQRALLCTLLLDANRVVSVDRLIEALWEDEPPETAVKAIQVHVSHLRKAIGDVVQRRGHGYVVTVAPHELDLQEFTDLAERGEYHAALRLWRGTALADLGATRFAAGEVARLEELRLGCLERRIDADLAAGRGTELVGELESLVRTNPLRERLRAQLMLALYRAGRQADALEAFQAARSALVDELGIEPGRELRDLHQRILNQDSALDPLSAQVELMPPPLPADAGHAAVPAPQRETRKTVTVLCAAIEASGGNGARLDPETLRRTRGRVAAVILAAVNRHEGTVISDVGDAVMAIFGIPTVHEDDPVRALRAAWEIAMETVDLAAELRNKPSIALAVGVGVATGEVVVGGSLQPAGEPLSVATCLARRAPPGTVLVDESAHRLNRSEIVTRADDGAYVLVDCAPFAPPRTVARRSAMVGRERELRRLQDAFAQAAADRSCQLFTILGAAGVGKSRLVEEFLEQLDDAQVCRGRCLPYGEGITYWPVLEVVRDAVAIDDADSPETALGRLADALSDVDEPQRVARNLAELIGLSDGALAAEDAFAAVRVLIETLARDRPSVVVFDDIHWGESVFLDLVEHLADWTRDAAVVIICLARPELLDVRPTWGGGKLNATSILLEPLSDGESARLIANLDGHALDDDVRRRIVSGAEGNPLFVEEMLALALEDADGEVSVPRTIQALLAARLDRLDETERTVVECAAVGGKVFYDTAVGELASPADGETVARALAELVRKDLVRPERASLGGRTYRFRHLLIRDAAYEAIPKQRRAGLHERFAHWLEQATSERRTEYEEVVGYHLEQACLFLRQLGVADPHSDQLAHEAANRLGVAGRRAFVRSDAPAGINLVSRAVALLPPDDPQRVGLVPNVRVVQGMGTDFEWAERVLTEAIEAAATNGNRRLAATALVQRAFLRLFTEVDVTPDELLDTARRAAEAFEDLGDNLGLARAWRLTAQAHYLARRGGACTDASERALAYARLANDIFDQREILEWLAIALFLGPMPAEEAVRRCEQLLEETRGDVVAEVHVLGAQAFLLAMLRRTDEAFTLLARGQEMMEELGEWIWIYTWHSAAIHLWQGDAAAAETELRPAYEALKKLGERSHFSTMAHGLASAAYMQGRYDDAEELTRECEEAARANDVYSGIIWRSTRAKIFARKARFDDAAELAAEAVALARRGDFHIGTAEALMDLAEVEALAGRPHGAATAIQDALRFYELKGNLLAAERAQHALRDLEAAALPVANPGVAAP